MRKLRLSIATITAKMSRQCITLINQYFYRKNLKQSVILGKPRYVLVFQAEQADDSTLGPKQGGRDSEKT